MSGLPGGARCWVLSDGKPGTETQCLGLAEALGLTAEVKRIRLRPVFRWLQPWIRVGVPRGIEQARSLFQAPLPPVVITGGRRAVAAAVWLKRRAGRGLFSIMVQDPRIDPGLFDCVVAPWHDRLSGESVIQTDGSLHRVTPQRLEAAAERLAPRLAGLPRPWIAVLVGGSGGAYRFGPAEAGDLAEALESLARATGGSLLLTTSRRTEPDVAAILATRLGRVPGRVHHPQDAAGLEPGESAVLGFLGVADATLVTCDSVTMLSEAAATGRPVYVWTLPGGARKFSFFHSRMQGLGVARPFTGTLDLSWRYPPLNETERVAALIRARLARHFQTRKDP